MSFFSSRQYDILLSKFIYLSMGFSDGWAIPSKLDIVIFAWRVTWDYAYIPFNELDVTLTVPLMIHLCSAMEFE